MPEKGRIRASSEKVEIRVSTEEVESRRVPEKGPGKYRERVESRRVSEMWNLGKHWKG